MSATIAEPTQTFRSLIEDLAVGESYSRAVRRDADQLMKDEIPQIIESLRNSIQPTVYRVGMDRGRIFTIESGEFRTRSRDIIICVVVTRTK